jgi:dTMP kinase
MDDHERIALRPHDLRGRLIAVDGTDGSGKTTMLDRAERDLADRGFDVVRTRQPTTEARELAAFRHFLYEPERRDEVDYRALLCMMIGDRLQHIHQVIRPALAEGKMVLCDRYIYTQIVTTRTRGFRDEDWMYELYQHVIQPDVAVLCEAELETVCGRIRSRSTFEDSYLERAHVTANQTEYRAVATSLGMHVLDTTQEDASIAYKSMWSWIAATLPRETAR